MAAMHRARIENLHRFRRSREGYTPEKRDAQTVAGQLGLDSGAMVGRSGVSGRIWVRDHLFISYATEDWPLAEWLTRRLTAEGYRVWCDRFKLLGGESYPY